MPRYLIERFFDRISDEDMLAATVRSDRIAAERYPEITWEHSHVIVDDEGFVRTYCVYEAPSEDLVRKHSSRLGQHTIDDLQEIAGDVSPADFPPV